MRSTQQPTKSADDFISELKLTPHPLGCGYFLETDREPTKTKIEKDNGELVERNLSTCIIAIFKGNQINPLHRTNSTQIIHYYPGGNSNLLIHVFEKNGKLKTYRMPVDHFQLKILPKTWFALEVEDKNENAFAVTGHTVSPGFDVNDFELANRNALSFEFPQFSEFVTRFTLDSTKQSCKMSKDILECSAMDESIIKMNR
jgi:predicted cupin superfamily sugar epimerase